MPDGFIIISTVGSDDLRRTQRQSNDSSVRTSDLELSISLRQVSNGSFAKAATQRVTRRATAAMGRERLTNVWCLNAMLQSGERLL
ncbi:MAG: hypothetical protein ABJJ09_10035 [Ascidiaceihabitans sp.]|uniref:hypothetical protein n=1 Tax=Ascidiaceihabitans sp. TaxID=1872644 RepID=UPI003298DE55